MTAGDAPASEITATSFVPRFVTYSVRSSADSASPFGDAPRYCISVTRPAGATVDTVDTTLFAAVSITDTRSALSDATYRRDCAAFSTILFGLPLTGMRVTTCGAFVDRSTTTISRSRSLDT